MSKKNIFIITIILTMHISGFYDSFEVKEIKLFFKIILYLGLIFISFVLILLIKNRQTSKNNVHNIKRITLGMSNEQVINIMGDDCMKTIIMKDSVYSYETSIFMSGSIDIMFDEKMEVNRVIVPDEILSPVSH